MCFKIYQDILIYIYIYIYIYRNISKYRAVWCFVKSCIYFVHVLYIYIYVYIFWYIYIYIYCRTPDCQRSCLIGQRNYKRALGKGASKRQRHWVCMCVNTRAPWHLRLAKVPQIFQRDFEGRSPFERSIFEAKTPLVVAAGWRVYQTACPSHYHSSERRVVPPPPPSPRRHGSAYGERARAGVARRHGSAYGPGGELISMKLLRTN